MSDTTVASANTVSQWDRNIFREWVRDDQFARYTGRDINKIIQVTEKLTTNPGNQITQSLVTRLTGNGQTGDNTLEGNEEAIGNYGYAHTVNQLRHAVRIGKHEQSKTHIMMLNEAGPLLKDWRMATHRDDVIAAMLRVNVDGSTNYASTSESDKDTFTAANDSTVRRILFGEAIGNQSGTDHSASLLTIDSTNAVLDSGMVALAKRMAKLADPHLRPVTVNGYGEFFVMFVHPWAMRDLRSDSVISNAQQYAMPRGSKNPLFTDGDVLWDGVIVHEVPEITLLSSVGTSSIDVAPCFLCGAQAIGYAIGKRTHSIRDEWDYKNKQGVGVAETKVVNKLIFNSVQHGMVTVYASGVADS
jgi:N4-gp56 family major capsid protein